MVCRRRQFRPTMFSSQDTVLFTSLRRFSLAADRERLDAFLRRCRRLRYCDDNLPSVANLFDDADNERFKSILANSEHHYMPQRTGLSHCHYVRPRQHNKELIPKTRMLNKKDFIVRVLYRICTSCWTVGLLHRIALFNSLLWHVYVAFDNENENYYTTMLHMTLTAVIYCVITDDKNQQCFDITQQYMAGQRRRNVDGRPMLNIIYCIDLLAHKYTFVKQ